MNHQTYPQIVLLFEESESGDFPVYLASPGRRGVLTSRVVQEKQGV
jgi:hypothetical protein